MRALLLFFVGICVVSAQMSPTALNVALGNKVIELERTVDQMKAMLMSQQNALQQRGLLRSNLAADQAQAAQAQQAQAIAMACNRMQIPKDARGTPDLAKLMANNGQLLAPFLQCPQHVATLLQATTQAINFVTALRQRAAAGQTQARRPVARPAAPRLRSALSADQMPARRAAVAVNTVRRPPAARVARAVARSVTKGGSNSWLAPAQRNGPPPSAYAYGEKQDQQVGQPAQQVIEQMEKQEVNQFEQKSEDLHQKVMADLQEAMKNYKQSKSKAEKAKARDTLVDTYQAAMNQYAQEEGADKAQQLYQNTLVKAFNGEHVDGYSEAEESEDEHDSVESVESDDAKAQYSEVDDAYELQESYAEEESYQKRENPQTVNAKVQSESYAESTTANVNSRNTESYAEAASAPAAAAAPVSAVEAMPEDAAELNQYEFAQVSDQMVNDMELANEFEEQLRVEEQQARDDEKEFLADHPEFLEEQEENEPPVYMGTNLDKAVQEAQQAYQDYHNQYEQEESSGVSEQVVENHSMNPHEFEESGSDQYAEYDSMDDMFLI